MVVDYCLFDIYMYRELIVVNSEGIKDSLEDLWEDEIFFLFLASCILTVLLFVVYFLSDILTRSQFNLIEKTLLQTSEWMTNFL
jgi:hypothetical protein